MKKSASMDVSAAAATLGKLGGSVSSEAKAAAARRNGRKGGRPSKTGKNTNKTGA